MGTLSPLWMPVVATFAAAMLFVVTLRGRATRKAARATGTSVSALTPAELVSLLTAVVTLVSGVSSLVTNIRSGQGQALKDAIRQRDSARTETGSVRDSARGLLHFELRTWTQLPALKLESGSSPARIDDRSLSGDCRNGRQSLTFDGTGPAVLHCPKGAIRIELGVNTVLLVRPDQGVPSR